jgi:hypothetical protein
MCLPPPSSQPASSIIDKTQRMDQIPEWFPGSRLNYAENLLRYTSVWIQAFGLVLVEQAKGDSLLFPDSFALLFFKIISVSS